MTILARIHRYHTESWRRLPPRSVVFVMHVVLLGNALALWIRPEQFEVLIAYQELNDIVAAPVWGAVAFGLSILMLVLPMLCRGVQVTALGAVALFWALVSAAVLYGDGLVGLWCLVTLSRVGDSESEKYYFISPCAGGLSLEVDDKSLYLVTLSSPVGKLLTGKSVGDSVDLLQGGVKLPYEIINIE